MSRSVLTLAALGALLLSACAEPAAPPSRGTIVIGADLPLSGTDGALGQPVLAGIRFAIQQEGRLRGYDVALAAYDDTVQGTHDPDAGVIDLRRLIANPQVLGVIGPFNANLAVAEIPIAARNSMVLISPATTNECLTKKFAYCEGLASRLHGDLPVSFFRVSATDDLQGPAMAGYAFTTLGLKRVAVISDSTIYGRSLADGFQDRYITLGGSITMRFDYDPTTQFEFSGVLQQARRAGADGIYFGGITANGGCKLRAQMADNMPAGAVELGGEGFALDAQCIQDAGLNAAGMYGTLVSVNAADVPAAASIVQQFRRAHPNPEDYSVFTFPGYDAARVLLAAIARAIDARGGTLPSREEVRAQVAATEGFPSTVGAVSFDAAGDSSLRYVSIYATRGVPLAWTYVTQILL